MSLMGVFRTTGYKRDNGFSKLEMEDLKCRRKILMLADSDHNGRLKIKNKKTSAQNESYRVSGVANLKSGISFLKYRLGVFKELRKIRNKNYNKVFIYTTS